MKKLIAWDDVALALPAAVKAKLDADYSAIGAATPAEVAVAVAALVNAAPGTLDTLGELATALEAGDSAAAALLESVAGKAAIADLNAEITLARNASNLTSGTVADARLPSTAQAAVLNSTYEPLGTAKFAGADASLFVSPSGNDARDGLAPGTAKRTIAAALAALPSGAGTVNLGSGTYAENNLPLTSGLTIRAALGAVISATGDAFVIAPGGNVNHVTIDGPTINASGSAFKILNAVLSLSEIRAAIWQSTGTAPAIDATGLIDTKWDLDVTGTAAATTPLIRLLATGDYAINCNTFTGRATHSSSFVFHIEDGSGNSYAANNRIHDFNFEIPNAGAVKILSGHGNVLDNIGIYDLSVPATNLVRIGKSATSALTSRNNRVSSYFRAGGALAASNYDISLETGASQATVLDSCAATSGFAVDWGGNIAMTVGTDAGSVNAAFVSGATFVGIRHLRETKGNWFPASAVGAGAQFYETATNKVLTSDGTNWRDAMGTVVP